MTNEQMQEWLETALDEFIRILSGEEDSLNRLTPEARMAAETLFFTEGGYFDPREQTRLLFRYAGERGWGDAEMNPDAEEYMGILIAPHTKERSDDMGADRGEPTKH